MGDSAGGLFGFEMSTGKMRGAYKGHSGGISAVVCHREDPIVMSVGMDRFLHVHDLVSRKETAHVSAWKNTDPCDISNIPFPSPPPPSDIHRDPLLSFWVLSPLPVASHFQQTYLQSRLTSAWLIPEEWIISKEEDETAPYNPSDGEEENGGNAEDQGKPKTYVDHRLPHCRSLSFEHQSRAPTKTPFASKDAQNEEEEEDDDEDDDDAEDDDDNKEEDEEDDEEEDGEGPTQPPQKRRKGRI